MDENNIPLGLQKTPLPRMNESRRIFKMIFSRWVVVFGIIIIFLLFVVAIFAPQFAPYDPNVTALRHALEHPSLQHLVGTDEMGRDVLSRLIFGARVAAIVSVAVVFAAGAIGMFLGLLAGYFGGRIDTIIMRLMDALMALPPFVLMLAVAVMLGTGVTNIIIALIVGFTPTYCRLMRGQVLSVKENDYVMAAKAIGGNDIRIMFRHIAPNVFPPLFVIITLDLGFAILTEAALSFLGIGINPPTATWGAMINSGERYLLTNPLLSIAPGVFILLVVLAFNLVGDGLRDALDPRLRGVI